MILHMALVAIASQSGLRGLILSPDSTPIQGVRVEILDKIFYSDVDGKWGGDIPAHTKSRHSNDDSNRRNIMVILNGSPKIIFGSKWGAAGALNFSNANRESGFLAARTKNLTTSEQIKFLWNGRLIYEDSIKSANIDKEILMFIDTTRHPLSDWNPRIKYGWLTDNRDGKRYRIVKHFNLMWMAENAVAVGRTDSSRRCYNDSAINCKLYGGLYNWHEAMNGACPEGWRLPLYAEMDKFMSALFNQTSYYGKVDTKVFRSTSGWTKQYNESNDSLGLNVLPSGRMYSGGYSTWRGEFAGFWLTESGNPLVNEAKAIMIRGYIDWLTGQDNKMTYFSVRCVRDTLTAKSDVNFMYPW